MRTNSTYILYQYRFDVNIIRRRSLPLGWLYENEETRRIDEVPEVKELFEKHPKWDRNEFSHRCHLDKHFFEQGCLEFLYRDFPEYRGMYKVRIVCEG